MLAVLVIIAVYTVLKMKRWNDIQIYKSRLYRNTLNSFLQPGLPYI